MAASEATEEQKAFTVGLIKQFTTGVLTSDEVDVFVPIMEAKRQAAPQEKKDAFKAKMEALMGSCSDDDSASDNMKKLIGGIKAILMEAGEKKGKQPATDEDKAALKESFKAHFTVPANNPFMDEYSGELKPTLGAIIGSMFALGWKANGKPTSAEN